VDAITVLWASFTSSDVPSPLVGELARHLKVRPVAGSSDLEAMSRAVKPDIACFDFDRPSPENLEILRQFKVRNAAIPVMMLTDSEAQALWALRVRVWNYFVKPVPATDILLDIGRLGHLLAKRVGATPRRMLLPSGSYPQAADNPGAHCTHEASAIHRSEWILERATAYVSAHLNEDIKAINVARLCCMSYFHFSRTFKRVCGQSFSEFVQAARMRRATELLRQPTATITRVCYEVGFKDLGYFSRIFKHHVGMTPSAFSSMLQSKRPDRRSGEDRRTQMPALHEERRGYVPDARHIA